MLPGRVSHTATMVQDYTKITGDQGSVGSAAGVPQDDDAGNPYLVTMADDITDLHLLTQRLNHQALHDLQTGLPNRQYLVTRLEQVLGRPAPAAVVTLLHLDL